MQGITTQNVLAVFREAFFSAEVDEPKAHAFADANNRHVT